MHVLCVVDHPDPGSFTHALSARFLEGAASIGPSVELADLHAEGFDPRWRLADRAPDQDPAARAAIALEQARIERCDVLCLAFPLFWFGMPAMLKGWIDRVFTFGWAYDQVADPTQSLLRERIGVLLVPAGGNPAHWEPHGLAPAMDTIWRRGTLGYFGVPEPRIHLLNGSEGSETRRAALLERARQAGADLKATPP